MSDETVQGDAEDRITRERREHAMMKKVLERIAAYVPPDEIEEDSEGFTEWGLPADEAILMAYDNVIHEAQAALRQMKEQYDVG